MGFSYTNVCCGDLHFYVFCPDLKHFLTEKNYKQMMSRALFYLIPGGAFVAFYDVQNKPLFITAVLGRYLGTLDIRHNFKEFSQNFLSLEGKVKTDMFTTLDGVIQIAVQSKKPKEVALVTHQKECRGNIQEEHQQAIEEKDAALAIINNYLKDHDNTIQAIQYGM